MENEKLTNLINTEGIDVDEMLRPLTIKENIAAYAIAGTFIVGAITIGYGMYMGAATLTKKIMLERKAKKAEKEQEVQE